MGDFCSGRITRIGKKTLNANVIHLFPRPFVANSQAPRTDAPRYTADWLRNAVHIKYLSRDLPQFFNFDWEEEHDADGRREDIMFRHRIDADL